MSRDEGHIVDVGLSVAAPQRRARLNTVVARLAANVGPLPLVLLGFAIVLAYFEPRFVSTVNLQNVARQSAVLAILAFGQAFPILSGGFDISVGSVIAFTSIVTGLIALNAGSIAGIVGGIFFAGLLGTATGLIIARFHVSPFVVTLGMASLARGAALTTTHGQVVYGLPEGFAFVGRGTLFGLVPMPIVAAGLTFLICWFILTRTPFGRYIYAIGGNEEAARYAGINVGQYKMLAYMVNGLLVGLGAVVLTSRVGSGEPNLGLGSELEAIAAVVIGGVALGGGQGSIWGVALGVMTLSLLSNGLNLLGVSTYTQLMVIGVVIIVATVVDQLRHGKRF